MSTSKQLPSTSQDDSTSSQFSATEADAPARKPFVVPQLYREGRLVEETRDQDGFTFTVQSATTS